MLNKVSHTHKTLVMLRIGMVTDDNMGSSYVFQMKRLCATLTNQHLLKIPLNVTKTQCFQNHRRHVYTSEHKINNLESHITH